MIGINDQERRRFLAGRSEGDPSNRTPEGGLRYSTSHNELSLTAEIGKLEFSEKTRDHELWTWLHGVCIRSRVKVHDPSDIIGRDLPLRPWLDCRTHDGVRTLLRIVVEVKDMTQFMSQDGFQIVGAGRIPVLHDWVCWIPFVIKI